MNRMLLATTIAAMLLAGPAFAKDHGHDHGSKGHGHDRGGEHGMAMHAQGIRVGEPNPNGPEWKREGRHDNGRHLGQYKHWARGQRLPSTYLEQRYYVRDYRDYGLAAPPRGTVWVQPYQSDRRFYLVQVATGLISQILGR